MLSKIIILECNINFVYKFRFSDKLKHNLFNYPVSAKYGDNNIFKNLIESNLNDINNKGNLSSKFNNIDDDIAYNWRYEVDLDFGNNPINYGKYVTNINRKGGM